MTAPFFSALMPWLLLAWFFQKVIPVSSRTLRLCGAVAMSGIILMIPFQGRSLACWINSFMSSFSMPLLGIFIISILEMTFHRKIFSARDWRAVWIFGVVASLVLYPSALGLTRIDTYSLGWSPHGLVAAVAVITIVLLWKKNRFGVLLLLALGAFSFQLQASTNLWDYLIDPVFGVVSIIMVLRMMIQKLCSTS